MLIVLGEEVANPDRAALHGKQMGYAEYSSNYNDGAYVHEMAAWIKTVAPADKDAMLLRVMQGEAAYLSSMTGSGNGSAPTLGVR